MTSEALCTTLQQSEFPRRILKYTPSFRFSNIPSIPTLTAIDTNLQQTMGQLEGPSFIDVYIMNQHYQCQDKCQTQAPCQNGGFTNSRNCKVCKCPTGFGGPFCQLISPSFSPFCGGLLNAEEVENVYFLLKVFVFFWFQTSRRFDITIRQSTNTRSKTCVYHIKVTKTIMKFLRAIVDFRLPKEKRSS